MKRVCFVKKPGFSRKLNTNLRVKSYVTYAMGWIQGIHTISIRAATESRNTYISYALARNFQGKFGKKKSETATVINSNLIGFSEDPDFS